MAGTKKVKITLKRSLIGIPEKHRRIVHALGLRKRGRVVVHEDNAVTNGMVRKVNHLLVIERTKQ
jgi:large subunit ribosomal protein L30